MKKQIAITGIHTGVGKTIATAVLAEALGAHYWKPVQAGGLDETDSMIVKKLISNGESRVHPEGAILTQPLSPHTAAKMDGVTVDHTLFQWPKTDGFLLVETAGGVLSPMTNDSTMADFVDYYNIPTILISNNYLGSINHTLMSIEVLKKRDIALLGLVMNGEPNASSEDFIRTYTNIPFMATIPKFDVLDHNAVKQCAENIKVQLWQSLENAGY
jgi:dethiobiotin synthetase